MADVFHRSNSHSGERVSIMNRFEWLDTATSKIYFRPDRETVRKELTAHLEDLREASGMDEEAAVRAMGDPAEIAEELGRIHRPWWGYVWRLSRVIVYVAAIFAVVGLQANLGRVFYHTRPELPKGDALDTVSWGKEWPVLEKWYPAGTKKVGSYRLSIPMAWLISEKEGISDPEAAQEYPADLMICIRADTWWFWEPCSDDWNMLAANTITDSSGNSYIFTENAQDTREFWCKTWQEPLTTWYLLYLELPAPEDVPDWVDIPIGYGGVTIRVNLSAEVIT